MHHRWQSIAEKYSKNVYKATVDYKSRIYNRTKKHNLKVCHLLGVYIVIIK
jgi:hypothetical protein